MNFEKKEKKMEEINADKIRRIRDKLENLKEKEKRMIESGQAESSHFIETDIRPEIKIGELLDKEIFIYNKMIDFIENKNRGEDNFRIIWKDFEMIDKEAMASQNSSREQFAAYLRDLSAVMLIEEKKRRRESAK